MTTYYMVLSWLSKKNVCVFHKGWGLTNGGGLFLPNHLQWIQIPIHSHDECEEIFPGYITDGMVCAGGPGAATCNVWRKKFHEMLQNEIPFRFFVKLATFFSYVGRFWWSIGMSRRQWRKKIGWFSFFWIHWLYWCWCVH